MGNRIRREIAGNAAAKTFRAFLISAAMVLTAGIFFSVNAQNNDSTVTKAQNAVEQKVLSERGNVGTVIFPNAYRAETYFISNAQSGVRGRGTYAKNGNSTPETFSYDATVNTRNGSVEKVSYQFEGGGGGADTVPSWAVGTFRGRNPQSRVRVTLTIDSSGSVTALYDDGGQDKGTYSSGQVQFGQTLVWQLSQNGRSFRAASGGKSEKFKRLK